MDSLRLRPPSQASAMQALPSDLRTQFPGLADSGRGVRFAYLDTAATAQKPLAVIEAMDRFLRDGYGTVHRGLYARSVRSTAAYEDARDAIAAFVRAPRDEIVITAGCTDAMNLVAWSWGLAHLRAGDRILVSGLEHHAGLVPWQLVAARSGALVEPIPVLDSGDLDLDACRRLLAAGGVRVVVVAHVANSTGTVNPVRAMADLAHAHGALLLCDAAQSAPHRPLDVAALGCDWLAFGGHKVYGPTGIGVLWGRSAVLDAMPPWRGGGEMIERVSFAGTTFAKPPARFEAGTPPIVEAIGLAEACRWLHGVGLERIHAYEQSLHAYAEELLAAIPGLRRIGTAPQRGGVLAFTMPGAHAADIAAILDMEGIAIRAGHHCAQPVMDRYGVPATARISLGAYTTRGDLDAAARGLRTVARLFG